MASNINNSAAAKKFPTQLAQGVLSDMLTKELDAILLPLGSFDGSAFEAAKASLPRRLSLLVSQITASNPNDAALELCGVLRDQWRRIFAHPALPSITPSILESSLWLDTVTALYEATLATAAPLTKTVLRRGTLLLSTALPASKEPVSERASQQLALFEWWGDDVCGKRWRVTDPWSNEDVADVALTTILHAIARAGLTDFVALVVRKGCSIDNDFRGRSVDSAAVEAWFAGHFDVVAALVDNGLDLVRPYEEDGCPLAHVLITEARENVAFAVYLLQKRPEIITAVTSDKCFLQRNLVCIAIYTRNPAILDAVLSAGAQLEYRCRIDRSANLPVRPSFTDALAIGNPEMLRLLITKEKALEGWKEKYDETALASVSMALATLAASAFPGNPAFRGDRRHLLQQNPRAMECLEMALASGIVCPWGPGGYNSLLHQLYPFNSQGTADGCIFEEQNALRLLHLFHGAGFDVLRWASDACTEDANQKRIRLMRIAILVRQPLVLDWCFTVLKQPADFDLFTDIPKGMPSSWLSLALECKSLECVGLLLKKHNASLIFPGKPLMMQPIMGFLSGLSSYTDVEAEKTLDAIIERDPSVFAAECFGAAAIAELESELSAEQTAFPWNPLYMLIMRGMPRSLESLLARSLPGVAAMANRPTCCMMNVSRGLIRDRIAPIQSAVLARRWVELSLLLRYTDSRVTDTYGIGNGQTALDLIKREVGSVGGPPRALVAAVEARAKQELATKALRAAVGSSTNAFEDPSLKPLTEKEAKKKAKKKAAKKKSKAKKRAVANAGAGASSAPLPGEDYSDDSSSDDDDGAHEEEPDDNLVDSRNAPSLDLMLQQMGFKKE